MIGVRIVRWGVLDLRPGGSGNGWGGGLSLPPDELHDWFAPLSGRVER